MEINLVTISKLSSEIIDRDIIKIEHSDHPVLSDLSDSIYDKYPALWRAGEYRLFWEYAHKTYFEITDYFSYVTAIRLMVNKTIYVLIYDYGDYWDDNIAYLEELDCLEEEERKKRERNIYDVKLVPTISRAERMQEIDCKMSTISMSSSDEVTRSDSDVIRYACRNEPKLTCYTADLTESEKVMEDIQKGYPKSLNESRATPNVVFEKRSLKDSKGQDAKKDKIDKKKDKGNQKDNKKNGKKK